MSRQKGHSLPSRIGYIVGLWPNLSETFVANEIGLLLEVGEDVSVVSVYPAPQVSVQSLAPELQVRTVYHPRLPSATVLACHLRLALQNPRRYASALIRTVRASRGGPVHLLRGCYTFYQAGFVAQWALTNEIGHLHAHFAGRKTAVALAVHWLTGISYSFTVHAGAVYREAPRLPERVAHASFVVAVSEHIRQALLSACAGRFGQKVHMLRNGIPVEQFKPAGPRRGRPFTILAIGRLVAAKGFDYLLDACLSLQQRGFGFRCLMVGDGPRCADLIAAARHRGLAERVEFLGAQPNAAVRELLQTAHVLVAPSIVTPNLESDGIPAVLQEAMASRVPVVATSVGGIPELVEHMRTGLLVEPRDPVALADAIELLARQPVLAESLARAGEARVREGWDMRKSVESLRCLFHAAIAASAATAG